MQWEQDQQAALPQQGTGEDSTGFTGALSPVSRHWWEKCQQTDGDQGMPTKIVRLEHCPVRTGCGAKDGSMWSRDGFRTPDSTTVPSGKGLMRQGQALPSSASKEGERQWHQLKLEKFSLEIRTHF